eukprot:UN3213
MDLAISTYASIAEKLTQLRMEVPTAQSEEDLAQTCADARGFVIAVLAPFSIGVADMAGKPQWEQIVAWMFAMHAALLPMSPLASVEHCTCAVGVDSWQRPSAADFVEGRMKGGVILESTHHGLSVAYGIAVLHGAHADAAAATLEQGPMLDAILHPDWTLLRDWVSQACPS